MKIRFALSAAAAGLVIFAAGCGENPDDVAKNWYSAILNGDLKKADLCVIDTAEARRSNELCAEKIGECRQRSAVDPAAKAALQQVERAKFSKPEVVGDRATVTIAADGSVRLLLQKIGGKWKIADIK